MKPQRTGKTQLNNFIIFNNIEVWVGLFKHDVNH